MGEQLAYSVIATLPNEATLDEYVAWLRDGHIEAVVRGGASAGWVIRHDPLPGMPLRVEARYLFPSRAAFERYVAESAPALRAEGLARFPASRGVTFERVVGMVEWAWTGNVGRLE